MVVNVSAVRRAQLTATTNVAQLSMAITWHGDANHGTRKQTVVTWR